MLNNPSIKELSFLVYGLGLSGCSVIRYFKKNNLKILKYGTIKKKDYLKIIGQKILI